MTDAERDERLWQRAERFLAGKNVAAARASLESLIARQPGHVMARLRLSTIATSQGRYRDSLQQLLAIADRQPEDAHLLVLLAGMLHRLGESRAAIGCLEQPCLDRSRDPALLLEAAQLALQLEQVPRCLALLDAADRLGVVSAAALYARATAQIFTGELDAAQRSLQACLAVAPAHGQAHWALSRLRRQTATDNHLPGLRALLARRPESGNAIFLAFALFKELDDLGQHDQAWQVLQSGCAAKRQLLDYRVQDEQAAFDCLQRLQNPAAPLGLASATDQATPTFIIGMPRTGTTVLEQILGAHPSIRNAGELDDLPLQLRWIANRFSKSYLDATVLSAVRPEDYFQLGQRYLQHAGWRAAGKPVFTDKLPMNFLHVGMIAGAMPQARILHMVRGAMDTCFSNLKELFTDVYPYSYDLGELADHYGRYRRLMLHWHSQFPGRILDVAYEDLVADPQATAVKVLRFCGLAVDDDWDSSGRIGGIVSTASSVQVREPIHVRGIDAWRAYEKQLEPLRCRLQADGWL